MKVIKIGAEWCMGCIVMRPRWQKIEKNNPWLKTEYYDFDNDWDKIKKYELKSKKLPTFIFINKAGKEIDRHHGELSEGEIEKLLAQYKDQ